MHAIYLNCYGNLEIHKFTNFCGDRNPPGHHWKKNLVLTMIYKIYKYLVLTDLRPVCIYLTSEKKKIKKNAYKYSIPH
jgi:hypothetical protein